MRKINKCIVCHERPAAVPDRNVTGRPIKRVCRQCHVERLQSDFQPLLDALERKGIKQLDENGNEYKVKVKV